MLSFSSVSFADPFLTNCIHAPDYTTIDCHLYEEIGAYPVTYTDLDHPGTPGYLVLMDSGDPGDGWAGSSPDQQNLSLWSDVLWFQDNGNGYSTELTLIFQPSQFPSYATVANYGDGGYFILETHPGPTVWDPNDNGSRLFTIYSPETVPEPSGYAFLLGGFLGLGAVIRWRRRESQSV